MTWFKRIKHLGHILLASLSDSEDIICKQNYFTFQLNYFKPRFRNVAMSLTLCLYIYLRTFVIRFSAVSYGTYSIEAFVNLTFYGVKQLEGYDIFLTLLIATYSCCLLSEIIFVLYYIIDFVNFSHYCLRSSNIHIKLVSLLTAVSQKHVFGKNLFYMKNMNLPRPTVSSFAYAACELYLVKLGYFDVEDFTIDELNIIFTDICCY